MTKFFLRSLKHPVEVKLYVYELEISDPEWEPDEDLNWPKFYGELEISWPDEVFRIPVTEKILWGLATTGGKRNSSMKDWRNEQEWRDEN